MAIVLATQKQTKFPPSTDHDPPQKKTLSAGGSSLYSVIRLLDLNTACVSGDLEASEDSLGDFAGGWGGDRRYPARKIKAQQSSIKRTSGASKTSIFRFVRKQS